MFKQTSLTIITGGMLVSVSPGYAKDNNLTIEQPPADARHSDPESVLQPAYNLQRHLM